MKKVMLTSAMAVLFFVGLTSMVSKKATPSYPCTEVCRFYVEIGLFSTHGSCMSACRVCTNNGQGEVLADLCIRKIASGTD